MDNTILLHRCQKQELLNRLEHLASLRVFLFVSVVIFLVFWVACVLLLVFFFLEGGGVLRPMSCVPNIYLLIIYLHMFSLS